MKDHISRSALNVIRGIAITGYNLLVPAVLSRLFGLDALSTVLLALQVAGFTLYFESGVANSISYYATIDPTRASQLQRTGTKLMIAIGFCAALLINLAAWPISARLGHQRGIIFGFYTYLNIFLGCFVPLLIMNATLGVAQSKNQYCSILGYSILPRLGFITVLAMGLIGDHTHPLACLIAAALVMGILVVVGIWKYSLGFEVREWSKRLGGSDLDKKLLSSILHAGLWGVASFIIGYSTSMAFTIADHKIAGYILTILGGCFILLSFLYTLYVPLLSNITKHINSESYDTVARIYRSMIYCAITSGILLSLIIYNKSNIIFQKWLCLQEGLNFSKNMIFLIMIYTMIRSMGIPLSILIMANNKQRNYRIGPIIEALGAILGVLTSVKGHGIKGVLMCLSYGAAGSIVASLSISYRNPKWIGFKGRKPILLENSIIILITIAGIILISKLEI